MRRLPRDNRQRHGTSDVLQRLKNRLKSVGCFRGPTARPVRLDGGIQSEHLRGKPGREPVKRFQSPEERTCAFGFRCIQCHLRSIKGCTKPRLRCGKGIV